MSFTFETKSPELEEATKNMYAVLGGDDEEAIKAAMEDYSIALAEQAGKLAKEDLEKGVEVDTEEKVMAERGTRIFLTPQENRYFAEAVTKQTVEGLDEQFPTTLIEDIFKDLTEEHPILSAVDTKYTKAAIKYIYGDPAEQTAYWDVIPADLRQILIGTFKELDMTVTKLSGFIALPKSYFQLGPSWLANYVMTFLRDVMEGTLEATIVNGDGKLKPIGMMRQLSGSVDGVYPAKPEVKLTSLTPASFAGPRALLAREKMLNGRLSLIINPETNAVKVAPNLFFQNTENGTWAQVNLPYGIDVIESYAVPLDKAVLGNPKNYILAVAGNMAFEKYKETLAIEDMDLFTAKMFAAGVAKNPNAFVVLDLTDIEGIDVPEPEGEADIVKQDGINPVNETDSHALDREGKAIQQSPVV